MQKLKHIIIFSSLFLPHLGGVEQYTQSIARTLASDCDVTIFCLNTENQAEQESDQGFFVRRLSCYSLFKGRLPVPKISALRQVRTFFKSHKVDFVIIQTRLYPFNLWAASLMNHNKIPHILIEHGTGHIDYGNCWMNRLWKLYEHGLTIGFRFFCKDYYGVSQASLDWLQHFGIKGKGVLHNGVDPEDFISLEKFRREQFSIPQDADIIVFAGRIITEKGILILLQAFDQIDSDNVHLIVAGTGDLEIVKPWNANPRIHFLGQISHRELLSLIHESQIFCLPTMYPEGLPTVILEAGFLGIPVVTTDIGGIRDVIFDRITGVFVQPGNPDLLNRELQELLRNVSERKRLGTNLKKLINDEFIWPKIVVKVKALITDC